MVLNASHYHILSTEFSLPEQDANKLSFCGTKPKQMRAWLNEVASTQLKQFSIVLYKLLPEINRLNISASQRLELLGLLKPHIQECIDGLAEDFLRQPLSLTEEMTKIAAIAQALQRHLCDGYLISIRQLLASDKLSKGSHQELSTAIHHASHGLAQLLFRSYQLYIPRPPMLWRKMHLLFQIAQQNALENQMMPNESQQRAKKSSTKQAYLRALLLACSNTNQLRQIDIHYLYLMLEKWAAMVSLTTADKDTESLYWINTASDEGPCYRSHFEDSMDNEELAPTLLAINMKKVIELSRSIIGNPHIQDIPLYLQQSLLAHLHTSWCHQHKRNSARQPTEIVMEVRIGLKSAHQQLLGDTSFDDLIKDTDVSKQRNIGIAGALNIFSQSNISAKHKENDNQLESHTDSAIATDISEHGCCLRWSQAAPPQIKSGEIILVKKPETDNWQVGAIRWAQRLNRHTYVGVQFLPGHAQAAAASTTLNDGSITPFFRSVLLKNKHNDELSSIITPTIPFAPKQEIQLQTEDEYTKAKLNHLLMSSGTISQFSYQQF